MNPWYCSKCKKQWDRKDLIEIFATGLYVCEPCLTDWIPEEVEKISEYKHVNTKKESAPAWVQIGGRAPCDICGKVAFWYLNDCLCECQKREE